MAQLTLLLVLFAATIVLASTADRLKLPYPVLLLIFGLAVAFVPGVPLPTIAPELILPLVLPPLLFAAARRTSWREFYDNRRAIGLLAVALVAVTAAAVGVLLQALVPGLPLMAAIALGAMVAPPDPVVATVVARELRLPRRLKTVLEGEGLSNDATSLVLYEVAVASTVTGAFSPWRAGGTLLLAIALGIVVGLAVAFVTRWLLGKLPAHPAGTALLLVVPFAAYAAADYAHGSGVLAVVTLALALSRYADTESAQTRLVSGATWEIIELLVTGAAFAFVGLELRAVAHDVSGDLRTAIVQGAAITALVIVVRIVWIFAVTSIDENVRKRGGDRAEPVGWQEMAIASWSGMRGVVTLAAALGLPAAADGFPERNRLVFIAFFVVLATMLIQGLTLPPLVRRLGVLASRNDERDAERALAERAREAGLHRLREIRADGDIEDELIDQVQDSAVVMWRKLGTGPLDDDHRTAHTRLRHAWRVEELETEMLTAARQEVVSARDEPGGDAIVADRVLHRLDARSAHTRELPDPNEVE
ncbi:Na+/H+ antiporter [Antrihabitans cavernicola]|uniref:Na+/H+ antiporter n=1 Tax=Antrihabitans cavernicola TaxID=2495913 RepID=A0A5A7SAE7_9NOCA|nr:Na+/H+ antiporter [Spelaeibacter cavernicola]KAA0022269.1 Na+/H+ antiporter [Spelaeibacter cavernicola]